jgi:alkanesulfonate monooxygenase SsuD/methylene tetrahydromethanopterin reductase-like flavin-dependent oxidoreductase (luciferase family)
VEAARGHAPAVARELSRNRSPALVGYYTSVVDERGVVVFKPPAKAHWVLKGTTKDIADHKEEWFTNVAADGFNLLPTCVPNSLTQVVDLVLPELRHRGLFRTELRVGLYVRI